LAGYGTLARIRQAQGDISTALEIVNEAQQLAHRTDNRREFSRLKAYQARLWLKQGNVQGALRWARESGLRPGDEPTYERESEHLALAQVLLAQGEAEAALRLLEGLQMAEETAGRMGSVIKTLVLQSVARHALGAGDKALAPLERALSLAEPEGYVRTFLDRGAAVAATLARIIERGLHDAITAERPASAGYVRHLLSAFASSGRGTPSPSLPSWPYERLSDRELEVLRLFGAGWSTPDIARELVLTLNTVKTHLRNIYRKLDVHSGREAVAKARHSGLL
jgi:LuxR family maltose regulon positive regulatory protein